MNIKKALKQLEKTGARDDNYPDGSVLGLSTLAEFAKDVTAHIRHFFSGVPDLLRQKSQLTCYRNSSMTRNLESNFIGAAR